MYFSLLLCFVALCSALPKNWTQSYKTYKGYKVLEVWPKNLEQNDLLRSWMMENTELDFWQEPTKTLEPVHIMAGPSQLAKLMLALRKNDIEFTQHKDVESEVLSFLTKEAERRAKSSKAFDIDDFNTYDDIMTWVQNDLMTECQNNGRVYEYYATDIQSVESRDIPVVTVSSDGSDSKPVFFIDATIHAREWLAPATLLKIMYYVCTADESDAMLDTLDWVFLPVYNPDGYEFSWTNERLWRKNRVDNGNCFGVDLNRNFDYMHGTEGISTNPCSDLYCGESGNSEPETQAIAAELEKYKDRINGGGAYVTIHCYGYMWMHPWGNTVDNEGRQCERADDHDDMYAVAGATADAIEAVHNTRWARGTSCEVIYETTGGSDDYAKAVLGIKYPFCPELRGTGFIVSPDEIQPSFEEVWAGLVAKRDALQNL